ncbi:MAG: PAS domain-containing protein [Kiritimatiellae bacterium]|nr:PAS domain-containing protein [Kiritimatiellia bacterium]
MKTTIQKTPPVKNDSGSRRVLEDRGYLRTVVDSVMEPLFVIAPDFTILDVNQAACARYGQRRDEIVGRHCYEVSHVCDKSCSEDEAHCPVFRAFREGRQTRIVHQHTLSDGTTVWEEEIVSPVRGPDGRIPCVVQELRDITSLLKSREVIEQLKKELKTLKGLLPTCASCRKVRNERGEWEDMESYIRSHSDADFSHGFCDECMRTLYHISPEEAAAALKPRD